jgi:hypothetical protein
MEIILRLNHWTAWSDLRGGSCTEIKHHREEVWRQKIILRVPSKVAVLSANELYKYTFYI